VYAHFPTSALLAVHAATLGQYWHKLTDRTFTGIYHANFFDLAMMIPYFIVLFVLAIYGLHRYWLVYDYYTYAKNVQARRPWPSTGPELLFSCPSSTNAM
jgi:hypothetical protein